jgi:hypothetical protein
MPRLELAGAWPTRRSFGVRRGDRSPADGRWHAQEYVRLVTMPRMHARASVRLPRLKPQLGPEFAAALTHDATLLRRWRRVVPANILRDDAPRRWPVERYGVSWPGPFGRRGATVSP